jgi:hypothetical protein
MEQSPTAATREGYNGPVGQHNVTRHRRAALEGVGRRVTLR